MSVDEVRAWAESLTKAMSAALREAKPSGGQMLIETRDRVTLLALGRRGLVAPPGGPSGQDWPIMSNTGRLTRMGRIVRLYLLDRPESSREQCECSGIVACQWVKVGNELVSVCVRCGGDR